MGLFVLVLHPEKIDQSSLMNLCRPIVWKCHNGDEEPEYESKNKGKDKRKRKA